MGELTELEEEGKFNFMLNATGIPYLTKTSNPMAYKDEDPTTLKPQSCMTVQVGVFSLWDPEDMKKYQAVWSAVGLNAAQVLFEDQKWVEDKQSWKILLRWYIPSRMNRTELTDVRAGAIKGLSGFKHVKGPA